MEQLLRMEGILKEDKGVSMKKIFISHPFADDPVENKMKVDNICRDIGGDFLPVSPLHLFSFMENDDKREEIVNICCELIDICDEVWVYGESKGCKYEMEYALSKGKYVKRKY